MNKIEPITFTKPEIHKKAWGHKGDGIGELWIVNNDQYCLKVIKIGIGKKFSLHFHKYKSEVYYISDGLLVLKYIDLGDATEMKKELVPGDVVNIPAGNPHQLVAIIDSVIYEVSTTHFEEDSYRIAPGDSQKQKDGHKLPVDDVYPILNFTTIF